MSKLLAKHYDDMMRGDFSKIPTHELCVIIKDTLDTIKKKIDSQQLEDSNHWERMRAIRDTLEARVEEIQTQIALEEVATKLRSSLEVINKRA